jgi:AraC family L-rhamnose operon regulatory protein RhaS
VWAAPELATAFEGIQRIVEDGDVASDDTLMRIQVNLALLQLNKVLTSAGAPGVVRRDRTTETVRLFLSRIDEHLSFPWRIEDMAEQCGVSRGVFIQKCRDITNCTPHVYLLQSRLQEASRMLREDKDASLTDIAILCGFSSSAHFSSTFRKEFGQAPSQYRAEALAQASEISCTA